MAAITGIDMNLEKAAQKRIVKLPHLLLVTAVPPNTTFTGALMLHEMFKGWPEEKLSCFSIMNRDLDPAIHEVWKSIPYSHRKKPSEAKTRHLSGLAGAIECFLKEEYTKHLIVPRLARDVIAFARAVGAEKIWLTLEGQTMIRLADILQKQLPLPMVSQVWDPPSWWLRDNNTDPWTQRDVLKTFGSVLSKSQTVAAASFAMADEYRRLYKCNAVPVMPGVPVEWLMEPAKQLNSNDKLVIGFAGQLYANDEWSNLLKTLDGLDWTIEGRQVEVRVLGRKLQLHRTNSANIRYFGWRSQQEAIEILSHCDILFCPYWFSKVYETESRLSFPSKLSTYLAAGRPVLFNGPDYSSPARFLKEHDSAFLVLKHDEKELAQALSEMAQNTERYAQLAENGRLALEKHLTDQSMKRQFLGCLATEAGGAK